MSESGTKVPETDSVRLADGRSASQFVSQLIRGLSPDEPFDAHEVLTEHPSLMRHKSAVLDLALEQYWRQHDAGEKIDPSQFARDFPEYQASVRKMLEAFELVETGLKDDHLDGIEVGDEFLGFQLEEQLGRGAFSRVFLAVERNIKYDRTVVLKVCKFGDAEVKTLASLNHPSIVDMYFVKPDEETGLTAICMPFNSRTTLHAVMDRIGPNRAVGGAELLSVLRERNDVALEAPLSHAAQTLAKQSYIAVVIDFALQLAEGLAHAHARGICHGDIKPSNVLVTPEGRAMLFDFNLSYTHDDKQRVGGTLPYMSPEHLQAMAAAKDAEMHVDPRSDLFSFGVMLYELLCGELPFGDLPKQTSDRDALIPQLLERQRRGAPSLTVKNPHIDGHLAGLVARCLACEPAERMPSAEALADALRQARSHRLRRWARTNRRQALLLGLGLGGAALAGGAALFAYITRPVPSEGELAVEAAMNAFRSWEYAEAIVEFKKIPDEMFNNELRLAFGRSYMRQGDFQRANDQFAFARSHRQDHGPLLACIATNNAQMASLRSSKSDYLAAEAVLRALRTGSFDNPAMVNNVAYCKLRFQDPAQDELAEKMLMEQVREGEAVPQTYLNLAQIDWRAAGRARPRIAPDPALIESALDGLPSSRDLHTFATRVYLSCARAAGDSEQLRDLMVENAAEQMAKAAKLGAPEPLLRGVCGDLPEIDADPRFRDILAKAPPTADRVPIDGLANPLLDDDGLLFDLTKTLSRPLAGIQVFPEPEIAPKS